VLARLLPLLLALCTLVPAHVLARFVQACQEPDRCCCRKDDPKRDDGPAWERVDCCESPCAPERIAVPAIATPRSEMVVDIAPGVELEERDVVRPDAIATAPRARTRGPPLRVHAFVSRWLV
jgi:hypothetical protein